MALTITIGGVDQTARLMNARLDVEKRFASEQCRLRIIDRDDDTATAYRPEPDDTIRILHNSDLLFGGLVVRVTDERAVDDTGTVTVVEAHDWTFLTDQAYLMPQRIASQGALELFDTLIDTYLGAKSVTNISSSTTGGPVLPEIMIDTPDTPLRVVLDRITQECGWPWRINGDKQAALVEPGTLPGPVTLDPLTVLPGWTWEQESVANANRVCFRTEVPDAGPGPWEHVETRTADGVQTVFPVNVLPTELTGAVQTAGSAAASSLAVERLPASAKVRIGARFRIAKHTRLYEVSGDVTTNGSGQVTVGLVVGLEADVEVGDAVTFLPNAFVQLELNGTPTSLNGSPWVWDDVEGALINPSAAPTAGTSVVYRTWLTLGAYIRLWETSSPAVQTSVGSFDRSILVDGTIPNNGHTDLAAAAAYGRDVLTRRLTAPKRVTLQTYSPGWYPLLLADMDLGDRLIAGDYLVEAVRIRDLGIDAAFTTEHLPYEIEAFEGDDIRNGSSWIDYFRGLNPQGAVRFGTTFVPSPVTLHDVAVPGSTGTQATTGAYGRPRALLGLSGVSAKGNTGADVHWSLGAYGDATYRSVGVIGRDNQATTAQRSGMSSSHLIYSAASAAISQAAEVSSLDANGFTLNWTTVTGGGAISVLAFPESFATHAAVNNFTTRTTVGTTDVNCVYSSATFQPDVVFLYASRISGSAIQAPPSTGNEYAPILGIAVRGGNQGCLAGWAEGGAAAANTNQYLSESSALVIVQNGAVIVEAAVSFLATGFRLTYSTVAGSGYVIRALALKGGQYTLGFASAPTSPGAQVLAAAGQYPSAVFAMGLAATTGNTVHDGLGMTWGMAAREPANQYAIWGSDVDAADPSQCDKAVQANLLYFGTDNAPGTVRARASVSAWAQDEVTLSWADASTAFRYLWLAIGDV